MDLLGAVSGSANATLRFVDPLGRPRPRDDDSVGVLGFVAVVDGGGLLGLANSGWRRKGS